MLVLGADRLDGAWSLACHAAGAGPTVARALMPEHSSSMKYETTGLGLEDLRAGLASGKIVSVHLAMSPPARMVIGVYAPRFCGAPLQQWTCVAEADEATARAWFGRSLADAQVAFVALCANDAPEFETERVTIENFPWGDWRVQRAAVRRTDGTWEDRTGVVGAGTSQ